MANWDNADMLGRLQRVLARPATDAELPVANPATLAYELLSDAQIEVAERLAMEVPECNYTAIPLTTADNKLYQTSAATVEWLGEIELYRDSTLRGFPLKLGSFWDPAADFTVEDQRSVRLCNGRAFSYPTLTARAFVKPGVIDAATQPTIKPDRIRKAVVFLAAANFCDRGGKRNPKPFLNQYERAYRQTVTTLKPNQSSGVGGGRGWWTLTGDLGRRG